jgi:hypothetical protein
LLDICGNRAGTIRQTFFTIPGRNYTIALNYESQGEAPLGAHVRAHVSALNSDNSVVSTWLLTHANSGSWNLHWNYTQLSFIATNQSTTLEIASVTNNHNCMLFDNVTVIDASNSGCNGVPSTIPPSFLACGQTVEGYTTTASTENFTFTAFVAPMSLTLSTCGSSFDTTLLVEGPTGNMIRMCDDCGPCPLQTVMTVLLPTQGRYTVTLAGYSGAVGAYSLSTSCATASPPPLAMACGTNYSGATTYTTRTANYTLVIPAGIVKEVTLSTCGSAFDTMLAIYDSTGSLVSSCDDCGPCGTSSIVIATLQTGT